MLDPRDVKIYEETDEQLKKLPRKEVIKPLSERERLFCEIYTKIYNSTLAVVKAGFGYKAPHVYGHKLRSVPKVARYIRWLKLQVQKDFNLGPGDIMEQYIKIAFFDTSDYVQIKDGKVILKDSDSIDGQIIKSVKQGRDGVTIELADKMKALEKLEHYFSVMPPDWKQKVEEKKVELMQQRVEIERIKAGQNDEDIDDDGFIEALKDTAQEVWAD